MRYLTVIAFAAAVLSASPALAEDVTPPDTGLPEVPVCSKDGAPVAADYLQAAQDILTTTKAVDRMTMSIDATMPAVMDMLHKSTPDMPADVIAAFQTTLREEMVRNIPSLVAIESCIYVQHFSFDELSELAQFYKGTLGQKMLAETPVIFKESMALGQAWGQRAGRAAMQRVLAKMHHDGGKT